MSALLFFGLALGGGEPSSAREPAASVCRQAGMPTAVCLENAVASERAALRELRERLTSALGSEEASALRESSARFEELVDSECATFAEIAGGDSRASEAACRLEYLVARRALLGSILDADPDAGSSSSAPAPELPQAERPTVQPEPERVPAAIPEPEPPAAPAPRVDSPVRAVSAETETGRRPETIEMASPMVLEVDLPVLETLRRGYGWPTSETSRFVTEGVTVTRIVVEKRERRGAIEVLVTPSIHSERYLHRARVAVTLLSPVGEEIAASETDWFQIGRGVPAQQEGGLEKELRFELSPDQYGSLIDSVESPRLRLKVDVEE